MVFTPLPHNFATSLMVSPLRSKLTTSLYSAFICSAVFTEPTLRPSFPPFSIFLIDCKSVILYRLLVLLLPMVRPTCDNWWLLVDLITVGPLLLTPSPTGEGGGERPQFNHSSSGLEASMISFMLCQMLRQAATHAITMKRPVNTV